MACFISDDLLNVIFTEYCNDISYFSTILSCSLVCRDWNRIMNREDFWFVILKKILESEVTEIEQFLHSSSNYIRNYSKIFISSPTIKDLNKHKKLFLIYLKKLYQRIIIDEKQLKIKQNGIEKYGIDLSNVIVFRNSALKFVKRRNSFHFEMEFEQLLIYAYNYLVQYQNSNSEKETVKRILLKHMNSMVDYLESRPYGISLKTMVKSHNCHIQFCDFLFEFSSVETESAKLYMEYLMRRHGINIIPILSKTLILLQDKDIVFESIERNILQFRKIHHPLIIELLNHAIIYQDKFDSIINFIKTKRPNLYYNQLSGSNFISHIISDGTLLKKLQFLVREYKYLCVTSYKEQEIMFKIFMALKFTLSLTSLQIHENIETFKDMGLSKFAPHLFSAVLVAFNDPKFQLNYLRLIMEGFQGVKIQEYLISRSVKSLISILSEKNLETLKFLVEDCQIQFTPSNYLTIWNVDVYFSQPGKYLTDIKWIYKNFKAKLTTLNFYIFRLVNQEEKVHFQDVYNILTILPKYFNFKLTNQYINIIMAHWADICYEPEYCYFDFTSILH